LDLNSLAQTALKLAQPQLEARNIQLQTKLAAHLPQVLGDSNQLLQVCLHVTNNAAHTLSDGGGTLSVTTWTQANFVLLEFSEDGPGARDAQQVFDPFRPMHGGSPSQSLGFSTCYGIVQEHRGRILCQNRPEGGTLFRIELPIATASFFPASDKSSASLLNANAALTLGPSPGLD
jgi:signal transduction histidine kinase